MGVGLLGADYEVANGRYRFKKVFGGLNWRPDLRRRSGAGHRPSRNGEYLLAVEGKPITAAQNVYERVSEHRR